MTKNRTVLLLGVTILTVSILLQWALSTRLRGDPEIGDRLARTLPMKVGAWIGEDRMLADTERDLKTVLDTLHFDDHIYRVYHRNETEIGIYIAHWRQDNISVREVEGHAPDICWRLVGWKPHERVSARTLSLLQGSTPPGEYRTFSYGSQLNHVIYWHFLDGVVVENYGVHDIVPWWAMFRDTFRFGFHIRGEQYFIRLNSTQPLESFSTDPDVGELLLGILRVPSSVTDSTVTAAKSSIRK